MNNNNSSLSASALGDGAIFSTSVSLLVGSCALLVSALTAVVLLTNKHINAANNTNICWYLVGIALADMVNGFALAFTAGRRLINALDGGAGSDSDYDFHEQQQQSRLLIPRYACLVQGGSLFVLFGSKFSSLMTLVSSVDRLLAVFHYKWYYARCINNVGAKVMLACVLFSLSLTLLSVLNIAVDGTGRLPINHDCVTPKVMPTTFITFHYSLGLLCGVLSALMTTVSSVGLKLKSRVVKIVPAAITTITTTNNNSNKNQQPVGGENQQQHRESRLTKIMLCIALLDLVLVAAPYSIQLGLVVGGQLLSPMPIINVIGFSSFVAVSVKSLFAFVVYWRLKPSFKRAVFGLIRWNDSRVEPTQS